MNEYAQIGHEYQTSILNYFCEEDFWKFRLSRRKFSRKDETYSFVPESLPCTPIVKYEAEARRFNIHFHCWSDFNGYTEIRLASKYKPAGGAGKSRNGVGAETAGDQDRQTERCGGRCHDKGSRTDRSVIPRSEARTVRKADRRLAGRDRGVKTEILRVCNGK